MEPLPTHIRPEDEVYFQPPLLLAPMSFRSKWWLGIKLVCAAQVLWFPFTFFFALDEWLVRHASGFAESSTWLILSPVLLFLGILLGPLWASGLFRHWVASAIGQRLLRDLVAPTSEAERR